MNFPRSEARLICLEKFRKDEENFTPWQVANSPGAPISMDRFPFRAEDLFNMNHRTNGVVTRLTTLLNEEAFQAQRDPRVDHGNETHWTRW